MSEPSSDTYPLTPLEIAVGMPLGPDHSVPPLGDDDSTDSMLEALSVPIRRALTMDPCLVTFSGGRDSSALLALAADIARKEGLPPPIPFTFRFPGDDESNEIDWQEQVVRFVGISDWERVEIEDGAFDVLGPLATSSLRKHGLLWPSNAFSHTVPFKRAAGGIVITGAFGDEILTQDPRLVRMRSVLMGRRRANAKDVRRLVLRLVPVPALIFLDQALGFPGLPETEWLTPAADREAKLRFARDRAEKPLHFGREVDWWWRRRYPQALSRTLRILAADEGSQVAFPFLDPHFLRAFVRSGRWRGFVDRTQLMHLLFVDLLPEAVRSRSSKASFGGAFWGRYTDEFISDWDGDGLDPEIVNVDLVRETWKSWLDDSTARHFRMAPLLQHVWLAKDKASSGSIAKHV